MSGSVPVAERAAAGPLFAQLGKGDVVIAPKLDRLFRSALDALKVVEELKARGVKLLRPRQRVALPDGPPMPHFDVDIAIAKAKERWGMPALNS